FLQPQRSRSRARGSFPRVTCSGACSASHFNRHKSRPDPPPLSCVPNLDNLLTVPRERLKRLMGACDAEKLQELNEAIKLAVGVACGHRSFTAERESSHARGVLPRVVCSVLFGRHTLPCLVEIHPTPRAIG